MRPPTPAQVDGSTKGFPLSTAAVPLDAVADQRWSLAAGDLPLPVVVLRASALEHNLRLMQDWVDARGLLLAPHGKTTMAPYIFDRQLALGAWAITVATPQQLHVAWQHGVRRVVMANQLVDPGAARWACRTLQDDPGFELLVYVDSPAGARLLAAAATEAGLDRPLDVLLEVGHLGGRTGVRTKDQAEEVADTVVELSPRLRLRGVSGFEGLAPLARFAGDGDGPGDLVTQLLDDMASTYADLHGRGLLGEGHILTAGGSAVFDAVVDRLAPEVRPGGRLVLRSGCYVTHDHGMYAATSPLQSTGPEDRERTLRPALELWSHVQSVPEPGLALLTFGRRDTGHDYGFPRPLQHLPSSGGPGADLTTATISGVNDQHGYLRLPAGAVVEVGDRVVCGISHPCTTFDKWRVLPLVDDDDVVTGAVATYF